MLKSHQAEQLIFEWESTFLCTHCLHVSGSQNNHSTLDCNQRLIVLFFYAPSHNLRTLLLIGYGHDTISLQIICEIFYFKSMGLDHSFMWPIHSTELWYVTNNELKSLTTQNAITHFGFGLIFCLFLTIDTNRKNVTYMRNIGYLGLSVCPT